MRSEKTSRDIAIGTEIIRETYDSSVLSRMSGRAGSGSRYGAPGIAFEVMAVDRANASTILKPDIVTKVTKSSTATQVDAVTMQAGKVIERIQYKDTVSPSGVYKTINQVADGKYQQAQLKGTIEAAEKFNSAVKKSSISKTMESTGISHNTTQRLGDKFTGQPLNASNLGDAIKGSTAVAVGITAGVEVVKSIAEVDSLC